MALTLLGVWIIRLLGTAHEANELEDGSTRVGATPAATDPGFTRMLELYTGVHIDSGTTVAPLLNGAETYPALWRDLHAAQHAIAIQAYYANPARSSTA
jgi:phosphatidylserine/phosphatidylglycerophosphate/cardiolipin synthase-like enzyme